MTPVGIVGLGHMGRELAANLVGADLDVVAHDRVGPDAAPDGSTFAASVAEVARRASTVVLSLPDADAVRHVADEVADEPDRVTTQVVDASTTGVGAARAVAASLAEAGVGYVDAPVSGGVAGARARTLTVMYAAPADACAAVQPVLAALSDRRFRVGDEAGLGQALKLANNLLSATALAAASEAIAFGTAHGIDMATMLEVINASSGASAATRDKFVNHVLPDTYASGFANTLMAKDLALYLEAADDTETPTTVGRTTTELWSRFAADEPEADFTRIYPHVRGGRR